MDRLTTTKSYKIESFAKSDKGLIRSNNEDAFRELLPEQFFILADGMGGHNAGEVAALRAVEYMCSAIQHLFLHPPDTLDIESLICHTQTLIENTNLWIHHLASLSPDLRGMGTTLCGLLFFQDRAIYSHVGDSRIYHFRDGNLKQLTIDHLVKNSPPAPFETFTEYQNPLSYSRKLLTQAIGTSMRVMPQVEATEVEAGDIYLLCSDGLTDLVPDWAIRQLLTREGDLNQMGDALIERAKASGGHDNITLVLVRIHDLF